MSKMAKNERNTRADVETVIRDMQRDLDRRIDVIKSELKEKGPDATESIERSLSEMRTGFGDRLSEMRDGLDKAHESFDDAVQTGRTSIQERPLMAVGAAVVVGVMIGLVFGRKSGGQKSTD